MIVSMTGFGSASARQEGVACVVEVRAVNNRFFKAVIKLPDKLTALEPEVDKLLRDAIYRGSLVVSVAVKDERLMGSVAVNQEVLGTYVQEIKKLKKSLQEDGVQAAVDLAAVLNLPGVCVAGEDTQEYLETHRGLVMRLVKQAVGGLMEMRQREGQALWADLVKHLQVIREALLGVQRIAPTVSRQYHEKLRARVLQMVADAKLSFSDHDLLKEVALFTDRADISEEIQRLSGHVEQFTVVCQKEDQAGRKLDFIAQEMLREANTIASKANDSEISKLTVDMKSAIDRIKEQVQNVE